MAVEIVNWLEIPVVDMTGARAFYEAVFKFRIVDLEIGGDTYPCFPNRDGEGFSGALVQYDFTQPGKHGPIVYLNAYGDLEAMLARIVSASGKVVQAKQEIAPGYEYVAVFEDTEGNLLALQG